MRCPKCHYISFENGDRCRNCGYEFSLAVDVQSIDLPIQTGDEATGPLADLRLTDVDAAIAERTASEPAGGRRAAGASAPDLPLFSSEDPADDRPLVTPPAVPRAPLSVRRGAPAIARPHPRVAPEREEPELALDDDDAAPEPRETRRAIAVREERAATSSEQETAPLVRRIVAGLIDAVIILGIDAAIVYFTLQLSGLRVEEIALIPPVPFLTFVLLLNGGYFASFVAAGGQTIGKMATAIRVVPQNDAQGIRVSFGYAVLRTAAYLVSIVPVGLGLLPALFSADRRTLHDRLAETRVVKASPSPR
jgi:uncharacterized RDD family membrane protein YckC